MKRWHVKLLTDFELETLQKDATIEIIDVAFADYYSTDTLIYLKVIYKGNK